VTTAPTEKTFDPLVIEYRDKINPLLPLATKAYGSREQQTPAHEASREYTRLLAEFQDKGGSLPELAKALGKAYAGMRRRVVMRDVSVSAVKPRVKGKSEDLNDAAARVRAARIVSVEAYHDQLRYEFETGASMGGLARMLGVSSAAPLYYGVQRSIQRRTSV
jgi:hypothetical protein